MTGCVAYNECLEVLIKSQSLIRYALSFNGMRGRGRLANVNEYHDDTPQRESEDVF